MTNIVQIRIECRETTRSETVINGEVKTRRRGRVDYFRRSQKDSDPPVTKTHSASWSTETDD